MCFRYNNTPEPLAYSRTRRTASKGLSWSVEKHGNDDMKGKKTKGVRASTKARKTKGGTSDKLPPVSDSKTSDPHIPDRTGEETQAKAPPKLRINLGKLTSFNQATASGSTDSKSKDNSQVPENDLDSKSKVPPPKKRTVEQSDVPTLEKLKEDSMKSRERAEEDLNQPDTVRGKSKEKSKKKSKYKDKDKIVERSDNDSPVSSQLVESKNSSSAPTLIIKFARKTTKKSKGGNKPPDPVTEESGDPSDPSEKSQTQSDTFKVKPPSLVEEETGKDKPPDGSTKIQPIKITFSRRQDGYITHNPSKVTNTTQQSTNLTSPDPPSVDVR